ADVAHGAGHGRGAERRSRSPERPGSENAFRWAPSGLDGSHPRKCGTTDSLTSRAAVVAARDGVLNDLRREQFGGGKVPAGVSRKDRHLVLLTSSGDRLLAEGISGWRVRASADTHTQLSEENSPVSRSLRTCSSISNSDVSGLLRRICHSRSPLSLRISST